MKNIKENSSDNQKNANLAAARSDVTAPPTAASTSDTTPNPTSLNWADSEMAEVNANDGYTVVKSKKRRFSSTPEHAAKQPSRPAEKRGPQQQKRTTGPRAVPPREIKATRANIADARARQATTNHENYIFVELCPDILDYSYLKAMSTLLGGPKSITQFHRMNGHFIVGLADRELANRLVADGLEIEGTFLKVFPFRKRAERIVVANLPSFVEDSTIVNTLGQFGKVTSIAPILVKMGEFTFTDGRREAFILLREGVRLETLPTRLTIHSKGDTLSAFLSFGIKQNSSPRQAASPTDARPPPSPPPPQQPRRPTPAPATSASPVQPAKSSTEAPVTPSVPHPAEPRDLAQPAPVALPATLAALAAPRASHLSARPRDVGGKAVLTTPARGKAALEQLLEHLKKSPNLSIDWDKLPDLNCEEAQKILTSETTMKKRAPTLTVAQVTVLNKLHETIKALCPDSNSTIRKTLQKTRKEHHVDIAFVQETNAFHLGSGQDLCLGYNAVILAHPVAISGSGLACVFGPGVAVLRQRILWPDHIALATIDVHGEEMTAIAVHLAHEPRERNRQLELLAATAAQEEEGACWIIGDFNIRDRGPSSSSSSDALAALLDLAALVDVATQFDAAHLPTRVAMHGDQVESNRLDQILVPAGVLDRVSIYATSHYHLSDHRLVLLQVGPPTTAVSSPTQPRLAAMLRSASWTTIKAGLLAEARSLHDPRHAASDSYIYRARRYIAAQLEASYIRADYPSLPDLARAFRLRRPVSIIRDEQDNIIEGPELRRRAFETFQPRFARPTSDPAAGAAFIASSAPTTTRELSKEDPLHRPDISPSEIANAIEHLPRGKAPGWDGLPCELLVAFSEDFFAEALARVFAASRLRGALPPSTRRSSICLVPKARGGRGLDGYRPVALPSADYRVLAAILHRRLKPHLRTLVPECQTYAVPGRSPSWNIDMVTDAFEEATALGSPLAVMGVDLESAFDSLDRGFLEQGCAVSAALFSIATGPLLRRLELTLGVGNVIAYADDIVLLFHRNGDFERVATVFKEYKQASGVGVNLRKSAGLWCGAWRNRGDSPLGASCSTTSIRILGLDIAPRSTVAHREQHLLALLETACRRWTPFTRGLSLVGRARAANTLVGSTIQHHLHGYLPSSPTSPSCRPEWRGSSGGQTTRRGFPPTSWRGRSPSEASASTTSRPQLQLACLKGVQVALRGGRNAFSWLVKSGEAWIHPPPDDTRLQPRRLRLLKLWEEASNILGLNHRALPTAQLLDLPIIGGCQFLRPPDLLAPARWRGARVRDLIVEEHFIARPTRSDLADAAALGAFCQRLTSENAVGFGAESTPSSSSLAAAVVLRGTATPFLNGLTTRSARRALDRPRLAATPISRFLARWTPINPPSRIDWASLRRCAYSGHEADAALKLALHALPRSAPPVLPAGPSTAPSATVTGRPPHLQAWIFGGSGLEDDALSILASAKLRIYRYFVQVGLGEAVETRSSPGPGPSSDVVSFFHPPSSSCEDNKASDLLRNDRGLRLSNWLTNRDRSGKIYSGIYREEKLMSAGRKRIEGEEERSYVVYSKQRLLSQEVGLLLTSEAGLLLSLTVLQLLSQLKEDIPTERTQQPQTREEITSPITRSRALRLRIHVPPVSPTLRRNDTTYNRDNTSQHAPTRVHPSTHHIHHNTLQNQIADTQTLAKQNPHYPSQFPTLLHWYKHVFAQKKLAVPCLNIPPVKIPTNSNKIIAMRPYRVPICDQQLIGSQIQQMLENDIIELSFSPFSSPVTLVTKRDKTKRSTLMGKTYPVQYFIRALRTHERNYTISELECLTIVESVEKFRVYLMDAKLIKSHQPPASSGESKLILHCNGLHTLIRRGVTKVVISDTLKTDLLNTLHARYNHPGISQMTRLISAQYYWKGMSKDIANAIKTCPICQLTKSPRGPTFGELGQLPLATQPFDLVSLDTIAGFAKYGNTKTYLHVAVVYLTRYAWTVASRSTSIHTYQQVIKKVLQDGTPKRLLMDRAPAFTSPKFKRFLLNRNIHPLLTTINNPQANGLCKRLNATLTGKLRLLLLENPKIVWTKLVTRFTTVYNNTPHSVTRSLPIYLMFGTLSPELTEHLTPYPELDAARRIAHERTQTKHLRKLSQYFTGSYEILEIVSPNVVRINRPNLPLNRKTDTVHVNKLQYYNENKHYIAPATIANTRSAPGSATLNPFRHLMPDLFQHNEKHLEANTSQPFRHLTPDLFTATRFAPGLETITTSIPSKHQCNIASPRNVPQHVPPIQTPTCLLIQRKSRGVRSLSSYVLSVSIGSLDQPILCPHSCYYDFKFTPIQSNFQLTAPSLSPFITCVSMVLLDYIQQLRTMRADKENATANQAQLPSMLYNLEKFEGKGIVPFTKFIKDFELVYDLRTLDDARKRILLDNHLRGAAREFALQSQQIRLGYEELKESLEGRFRKRVSTREMRSQFFSCRQGAGERVRDFAARVSDLAAGAESDGLKIGISEVAEVFIDGLFPSLWEKFHLYQGEPWETLVTKLQWLEQRDEDYREAQRRQERPETG
ncbi:hypothetical protein LAZ67_11003315 [Cordylochernes scorpioides]|uniref:RNA-directed DNA polymerase n=1 Tax=Cordylochernes scorpioides TaxID=51811 RepID=A0ABY6KZR3_9ARAC|nr:hypothetical protein LAZ67_11003315 [Cordylochernes scorpioides]